MEDFNQSMILAFAEKFKSDQGFIQAHVIVLQHWWQRSSGDLDFDGSRFPKPAEMVRQLQKSNMKVCLIVINFANLDNFHI